MRDTRALLMRLVREYPGSKPADLAKALDKPPATVRKTHSRMAEQGQLRVAPGGAYYPPEPGDQPSDQARDTSPLSHLSLSHSNPSDQEESL